MTPAIRLLEKQNVPFSILEYEHDASNTAYGTEAAEKLGLNASSVFKTLVIQLDSGSLAVAMVPVNTTLNLKSAAKALGVKKAVMAEPLAVQRSTGYVLGGVSPLGQKRRLPTLLDCSAKSQPTINISAGRRGLEIQLAPADLVRLTSASFAELAAH